MIVDVSYSDTGKHSLRLYSKDCYLPGLFSLVFPYFFSLPYVRLEIVHENKIRPKRQDTLSAHCLLETQYERALVLELGFNNSHYTEGDEGEPMRLKLKARRVWQHLKIIISVNVCESWYFLFGERVGKKAKIFKER